MRKRQKENLKLGFTLIEIMIVITLLGLIMGFAVTNYTARQQEGNRKGAKILMKQLQTALEDYNRTCNVYPTDAEGLDALVKKPASNTCKDYDPNGYLNKVPQDPWQHTFVYLSDGKTYEIKSLGKDGREGGEGNDKDISTKDQDF